MKKRPKFLPRLCGVLVILLICLCLPPYSALAELDGGASTQDEKMVIEVLEGEDVEYLDPDWVVIGMDEYQAAKRKTEEAELERESKKRTLIISASVGAAGLAGATAVLLVRRNQKQKRK